jgi:hypothetical protein
VTNACRCPCCKGTGVSLLPVCDWCRGTGCVSRDVALRYADVTDTLATGGFYYGDHNYDDMMTMQAQAAEIRSSMP